MPTISWTATYTGNIDSSHIQWIVTIADIDAGNSSHFYAQNIPGNITSINETVLANLGITASNEYDGTGYIGPFPPAGTTHRYAISVIPVPVDGWGVHPDLITNSDTETYRNATCSTPPPPPPPPPPSTGGGNTLRNLFDIETHEVIIDNDAYLRTFKDSYINALRRWNNMLRYNTNFWNNFVGNRPVINPADISGVNQNGDLSVSIHGSWDGMTVNNYSQDRLDAIVSNLRNRFSVTSVDIHNNVGIFSVDAPNQSFIAACGGEHSAYAHSSTNLTITGVNFGSYRLIINRPKFGDSRYSSKDRESILVHELGHAIGVTSAIFAWNPGNGYTVCNANGSMLENPNNTNQRFCFLVPPSLDGTNNNCGNSMMDLLAVYRNYIRDQSATRIVIQDAIRSVSANGVVSYSFGAHWNIYSRTINGVQYPGLCIEIMNPIFDSTYEGGGVVTDLTRTYLRGLGYEAIGSAEGDVLKVNGSETDICSRSNQVSRNSNLITCESRPIIDAIDANFDDLEQRGVVAPRRSIFYN
jgi:hypothetical protein